MVDIEKADLDEEGLFQRMFTQQHPHQTKAGAPDQNREQRVKGRRATERPHVSKTDRRRTGRSEQMNLKVKRRVRDEFAKLAKDRKMTQGEFLEQVLADWKELGGGQ